MTSPTGRRLDALAILQSRPGVTARELGARLGVNERTARRDVSHLRDLGYRVDAVPGRHGGYRLAGGARLPPLVLDADEALAVALGLRTSAGVRGLELAAATALAKVTESVPSRLRARVDAVARAEGAPADQGRTSDPQVFLALALACRAGEAVRIRQHRSGVGLPRSRDTQPHRLVVVGARWYLLACDRDEQAWKTYAVDRISRVQALGTRLPTSDAPEDATTAVESMLSLAPRTHNVRLRAHTSADLVRALVDRTVARVEAEGPDACIITLTTDDLDWAARWIVYRNLDLDVLEPTALRERIQVLGKYLAARWAEETTPPF